jgi:hypothetical protein
MATRDVRGALLLASLALMLQFYAGHVFAMA